eukprot:GHVS01069725.1.p1 GENE.GHVS01069725.1~~GHVS01069725.1.p1  ORF type:complete len:208 (-),score=39.07 GHVS01069725.1:529-1152(-)
MSGPTHPICLSSPHPAPFNPRAPPLLPKHITPPSSPPPLSPSSTAAYSRRWAWTPLLEGLRFQTRSLYSTFFYTKANVKYAMVFLFPSFLWATRWRADSQLGYHLFIEEEELYPDYSRHKFFDTKWSNGRKVYLPDTTTVRDLKEKIYEGRVPEEVLVGCHGRMMEDSDNLAMAVKAFCRRDPRILLWRDDVVAMPSATTATTAGGV